MHNARLHDQVQQDARRQQVALEMLSYHTRAHPKEVEALSTATISQYVTTLLLFIYLFIY